MKIETRLPQVIQHYGIRMYGAQKRIADHLEVDRQTVARLFSNKTKSLSLENIEGLCRWLLVEVDPRYRNKLRKELPGCLFSMAGLWERMFRSRRVTTYLGEKVLDMSERDGHMTAPARAWVSSMDVTTALKITQRLAREESAARHHTELVSFHLAESPDALRSPAFARDQERERQRAQDLFDAVLTKDGETSLIVGSQKVNLLSEIATSHRLKIDPFKQPRKSLPFYVSYRDTDPPTPQSSFGGPGGPRGLRGTPQPGIYYRDGSRTWELAPWELKKTTAGLVLVHHDATRDSLEVVLSGFCAQGTRLLGDIFCERPDEFWPARRENHPDRFGVFLVPIQMEGDERLEPEQPKTIALDV